MPKTTPLKDQEVKVQEQGTLTSEYATDASTTQLDTTITVATGKIVILKTVYAYVQTAISGGYVRIKNPSGETVYNKNLATTGTEDTFESIQAIHLPAGWQIVVRTTKATAGSHTHGIIYQEYDA